MIVETQNSGIKGSAVQDPAAQVASASVTAISGAGRQAVAANDQTLPQGDANGANVEPEKLSAAVRDINDYVQRVQRTLQFSVDDDTGTTVVKVLDSETDEVIRQFPPEEALALARHLQASQDTQAVDGNGLILSARA
ncbi:MAG: flagellar protein FlaG [Pseudomonadota bacterium]